MPSLAVCLELLKPITWFPPMWAFGCGVVSAGTQSWGLIAVGVLLCGPLVCGTSQAVNDWFDRHVDAINEPQRPIPSGRIPGRWGLYIAIGWTAVSLLVATFLGTWGFAATVLGLVLAWLYSAPPVRLKMNGWWGNAACGACYEGLPWITGAAVMTAAAPDGKVLAVAALYSIGAHGIMTLNDFKAIEGDRAMGIRSLPAALGPDLAARVANGFMTYAQVIVVALLLAWGHVLHAGAVGILLAVQIAMMSHFEREPVRRALWYSGFGVPLFVIGMLVTAFAISP
jgi:chlorophyll synthase